MLFEVRIRKRNDEVVSRHFDVSDPKVAGRKGGEIGKVISVRKVSRDNEHMLGNIEKLNLKQRPKFEFDGVIREETTVSEIVFGSRGRKKKWNGGKAERKED